MICLLPVGSFAAAGFASTDNATRAAKFNVVFDSPCKDFHGAMPLGNGDIGVNAWFQDNGELLFYISKTDAYDDNNRLLKLGLIRVTLKPNPLIQGGPYRQELSVDKGEFVVTMGKTEETVRLRLWVDANQPVIHVDVESRKPLDARVALESWRTRERKLEDQEISHSDVFRGDTSNNGRPRDTIQYPDTFLSGQKDRVVWYHYNQHSAWSETMKLQGLQSVMSNETDPLQERIFGGEMLGKGFVNESDTSLKSAKPNTRHSVNIFIMTDLRSKPQWWKSKTDALIARASKMSPEKTLQSHRAWWRNFWNRSWIDISGPLDARPTTQGYVLQRYLNICGGRGNAWMKYNGSIFTLPYRHDPDYRQWACAGWFQNNRLVYWPTIAAGDFDSIQPFFDTYFKALSLAKSRTRIYYGHEGAVFPETMYEWGTYCNGDYGWNRGDRPLGYTDNPYVRYYWQGGIELSTMMLDYYTYTGDEKFAVRMVPFISEIIKFYDQHYKRDANGKIRFEPAQSLETWHVAVNPLPEIAGLRYLLPRLVELPRTLATEQQRTEWKRVLGELPEIPMKTEAGKTFLLPADSYSAEANSENPELYAVFPYRIYGVGRDGIEIGRDTYARRRYPGNYCWKQDDIQSSLLGLASEARKNLSGRFANRNTEYRFPASYGPGFDELPDMDHGGVGLMALQTMLLQPVGDKILFFPAWPKEWNVEFKLNAPKKTTVEGVYKDGKLVDLKVMPKSRAKDVVVMTPQ